MQLMWYLKKKLKSFNAYMRKEKKKISGISCYFKKLKEEKQIKFLKKQKEGKNR